MRILQKRLRLVSWRRLSVVDSLILHSIGCRGQFRLAYQMLSIAIGCTLLFRLTRQRWRNHRRSENRHLEKRRISARSRLCSFRHLWVHHAANECSIVANARYCLLSSPSHTREWKVNVLNTWVLSGSLCLGSPRWRPPITHYGQYAPEMQQLRAVDAIRIGWFGCGSGPSRQTVANLKSAALQPASVINERARWNMTKPARRLRARTADRRRRDFSAQREEPSQSGQLTRPAGRIAGYTSKRGPSVNQQDICKAGRVVLAKWDYFRLDYLCWPNVGQAEAQPDGRQHKTESFAITNGNLIIT